ncbi:MAG: DUF1189 domain-containing protein [Nitrospiraceae bacterium]|nr:DUF1189 domain-containing protein [Nitrospiraceae bacterium]
MRKYSTINALYMSFFSKSLYKDVGADWKGISFVYLLLLLVLISIPMMFQLQSSLNTFIDNEVPKLIKQVPEIKITDGIVTTDVSMPYTINDTETDRPLIVIDTTGKINSIEDANAQALLTKNKLLIRKSKIETRTIELTDIESFTINQSNLYEWTDIFRTWIIIILYPFILFFLYAYRTVQALAYALIGKIFGRALKTDLNYQALISLAIVSMTPAIIINAVYSYINRRIPFWWVICFIIAMCYLYFAVRSISGKEVEIKQ